MKNFFILTSVAVALCACNSIYVKPNTLQRGSKIYAARGGYSMKRTIKQILEQDGFDVVVGKAISLSDDDEYTKIPDDAQYVVRVNERQEKWNLYWCPLNGGWWWNFSVSISNQETGEELMTWRGRGCSDSSVRLLEKTLKKMYTD